MKTAVTEASHPVPHGSTDSVVGLNFKVRMDLARYPDMNGGEIMEYQVEYKPSKKLQI